MIIFALNIFNPLRLSHLCRSPHGVRAKYTLNEVRVSAF